MFNANKRAYLGVRDLTLITVSNWLAGLVRQSFLGEYPIEVQRNKVDRSIFKPSPSDFKRRMGIEDKRMILGVASFWERRKGLDDFYCLAKLMPEDCVIVLVGLTRQQVQKLPPRIIGLTRTESPQELAEIYTAADVFFNPSREETFSMVNAEACCCGTEVVIYDSSAMPESVEGFANATVLGENTVAAFLRVFEKKGRGRLLNGNASLS